MKLATVIPILRSFDEAKAKEFYVGFLEFKVEWEHRFDPHSPLYMQVTKDDCVLHLSEHYGDACPGSAVRIATEGIEEYHKLLLGKNYKYYHPGIEDTPWHTREMCVQDPFGNRLIFCQSKEA